MFTLRMAGHTFLLSAVDILQVWRWDGWGSRLTNYGWSMGMIMASLGGFTYQNPMNIALI